jgi:glycosyltransferase involved in cell wall biosynthesis
MASHSTSVVIPSYNGARHVGMTIASVLAQSHAVAEIIVVDDGSSDGSLEEVARAVHGATPRIQVIESKRLGVAAVRNVGLGSARSEWVCFLDQDDLWHPRHLQTQFAALDRHPEAGVLVSPFRHWYPTSDAEQPSWAPATEPDGSCDVAFTGWVYHQFLLDCWALTSATSIRREVLQTHGTFDPLRPYSEDWELWLRLSRNVQFLKVTSPTVLYRQHAVQGSRVARPVDHRSDLLESTARQHGLTSADGRHIGSALFSARLARYRMEFGYQHLQYGDVGLGIRSLLKAWRRDPARMRYLAMAAAAMAGWRPGRHGAGLPVAKS